FRRQAARYPCSRRRVRLGDHSPRRARDRRLPVRLPAEVMRIAAHLGVKDEIELIEASIAHLRAIGVDLIIAVDGYSTDGTAEVLASHRGEDFWFVQMNYLEPVDGARSWLDRNLDLVKQAGVDWAIFLDADEFWLPASGSLKDCAGIAAHDLL